MSTIELLFLFTLYISACASKRHSLDFLPVQLTGLWDNDGDGIIGVANEDYPVFGKIPKTKFDCKGKLPGFYSDTETGCQVYHVCEHGKKISFLCNNGTLFNQKVFTCDWWYQVSCDESANFYKLNELLYKEEATVHSTPGLELSNRSGSDKKRAETDGRLTGNGKSKAATVRTVQTVPSGQYPTQAGRPVLVAVTKPSSGEPKLTESKSKRHPEQFQNVQFKILKAEKVRYLDRLRVQSTTEAAYQSRPEQFDSSVRHEEDEEEEEEEEGDDGDREQGTELSAEFDDEQIQLNTELPEDIAVQVDQSKYRDAVHQAQSGGHKGKEDHYARQAHLHQHQVGNKDVQDKDTHHQPASQLASSPPSHHPRHRPRHHQGPAVVHSVHPSMPNVQRPRYVAATMRNVHGSPMQLP
ncbi:hypothetical protein HDE_14202 [Halotydeus destructor]|nr:hypothetical protein HDE_14202 [Halotydeus destructor]